MRCHVLPLFGASLLSAGHIFAGADTRPSTEAIVVAESTAPASEHVVSYMAYDAGYIETGRPVGGVKLPDAMRVGQILQKSLDHAGFEAAPAGETPTLVIVYNYGWVRGKPADTSFTTESRSPAADLPPLVQVDDHGFGQSSSGMVIPTNPSVGRPRLKARLRMVATTETTDEVLDQVAYRRPPHLSRDLRAALNDAADPRFFLVVSAYDYADLLKKKNTLRWSVRLSTHEHDGRLDEVIPALAAMSAGYLGRDLDSAQTVPLVTAATLNPADTVLHFQPSHASSSQIDPKFMRRFLRKERARNTGLPESEAGYAPRPPGGEHLAQQ